MFIGSMLVCDFAHSKQAPSSVDCWVVVWFFAGNTNNFVVNRDGVVWQRDLGKDTAQAAAAIQQFNPDNSWTPLAPEG